MPEGYESKYLVNKTKLSNYLCESVSFWYREDVFIDNDSLITLDIESLSGSILGIMSFIE